MSKTSKREITTQKTKKLRSVLATLPPFCLDFFRGIEQTTSLLTRINYAYDLRLFFKFLEDECGKDVNHMCAKDLENVTMTNFEVYLEYLTLYLKNETVIQNNENGIARKLSSIRSMYKYYYKKEMIDTNITTKLATPKIHEKPIVRMSLDETHALLHIIDTGIGLSDRQLSYHKNSRKRDLAIFTLLLTTGIRISELCALDVSDFDFERHAFKVLRKGGNEVMLYFGDEANDALLQYLDERKNKATYADDSPMFLSMQKKRISVRALQMLVEKYASIAVPLKNISPHKLRSTFGTMLYHNTGDIYLVADVLGHKDVNTTRKHYAAIDEDRRKMASKAVKLAVQDQKNE